jgi:hypothetical protein
MIFWNTLGFGDAALCAPAHSLKGEAHGDTYSFWSLYYSIV